MLEIFKKNLFNNCRADKNSRFLLAVSGGIDSVVLAHLFYQAELNFSIAHCNFKLRSKAANQDQKFVEDLAKSFDVTCYSKSFETKVYSEQNKVSIQMAARSLRYEWFEEIRKEEKFHFIVTAHHANDQAETIFINLINGTGIKGLSGMRFKHGYILRPLLSISKESINLYAKKHQIEFREDSSNAEDKYLRNNIRLNLIPIAEKINPNIFYEIKNFSDRMNETQTIFELGVKTILKKLIQKKGVDQLIPIRLLQKYEAVNTILFELLSPLNFTAAQCEQVFKLLDNQSGKKVLSYSHRVLKDRNHLIITSLDNIDLSTIHTIPSSKEKIKIADFILDVTNKNPLKYKIENSPKIAVFDAEKIVFPLTLRKWKAGDYFYPFGLTKPNSDKIGKKKLKKFFSDEKISVRAKEKIWILQDAQDRILWIVGIRTDARFSVTEQSKKIIRLKLTHVAKDYLSL